MSWHALPIVSPQNARFKQLLRLRKSRQRRRQERFLIDGRREIDCAFAAGWTLHEVYLPSDQATEADDMLLSQFARRQVDLFTLSETLLSRVSYGGRCDQWVAVASPRPCDLNSLRLAAPALVCVIEHVEKPGNLGAVVRSADGAALDAILVADGDTDLYNPNAIRASRGTLFTMPIVAEPSAVIQDWLMRQALQVCVASPAATLDYDQVDFTLPTAFVLGSEAHGLSAAWDDPRFVGIRLPMLGRADSLNVAATAAILFYEARRQRRQAS